MRGRSEFYSGMFFTPHYDGHRYYRPSQYKYNAKKVPTPKHNTMNVYGTWSASFPKREPGVTGKYKTNIR
jgi:hypothetical protein